MKRFLWFGLSLLLLFGCAAPETPVTPEVPETPEEPKPPAEPAFRSKFDGSGLDKETYKAVAVMIGNTSEARPQSGLSQADVVYEIMMEGMSITRLMAIFGSEYPEKVGPIRSIRIPFVQKLDEWDVAVAHYGGAETGKGDALSLLETIDVPMRFDGVKGINTAYFWRDSARKAPHNAYMNLSKAIQKVPVMTIRKHFTFNPEAKLSGDEVSTLKIRFASSNIVRYDYDPEGQRYLRSVNDEQQFDALNDEPLTATNLILQTVPYRIVEKVGYVLPDFTGSGKADYYIGGQHVEGTWEKPKSTDVTVYYDANHQEIELLPGSTWIEVVLKDSTKITAE